MTESMETKVYDVAIIGGGAAGLSAGVVLSRARRSVVVIDSGEPRNAPAEGVHSFLSRDGMKPTELLAEGRRELASYGGTFVAGMAVGAERNGEHFVVDLAGGDRITARRLLVTTGLVDELPPIAGLQERWGHDVLACPYCHGWEVQDQPIGVIGSGPMSFHQVWQFSQWTSDLVYFRHTAPELTPEQAMQLAALGVEVVDGEVVEVQSSDDAITGLRLADGSIHPRRVVVTGSQMVARSAVLAGVGLSPDPHPSGMGESIPSGPMGATDVPGVWVAGNVTDLAAKVIVAAAAGVMSAVAINVDLLTEDTEAAVAAMREPAEVSA